MFVAKDFVFLEMQKTGGSHILKLLRRYTHGENFGKHNRLIDAYKDKFIIGSIRNPWDWYVSLWAYGVSGKGAIRARTTKRVDFNYYYVGLPKSMGKNWLNINQLARAISNDITKPTQEWRLSYKSPDDPNNFRRWLKLVLDSKRKYDLGEGYAFSPLSKIAGLMTYRYFRLFTLGDLIYKDDSLISHHGLQEFDRKWNILRAIIRNEHLEEDFIRVLDMAGYRLSPEQVQEVYDEKKTNVSSRNATAYYYDRETIELVSEKEAYLINKYGYASPDAET